MRGYGFILQRLQCNNVASNQFSGLNINALLGQNKIFYSQYWDEIMDVLFRVFYKSAQVQQQFELN